MYISEPVLSYSYLSKGVDEAWVLHKYPYFYLSTDCEYLCHLCIPWPLLPDFLEPLIKLAKPPSISLNFNPLKCTGLRLTDGLVVTLPRLLSVFPVSGHCAKLSRGRHLRFPIATFRPIPTPLSARSVRAHASPWAWTWASHPRPTPRSSWVRMTRFVTGHLLWRSIYKKKKKRSLRYVLSPWVHVYLVCPSGTRKSFDHLISDSKAPKRPEMESGMTTPPKMRRVAENDYEIGRPSCIYITVFHGKQNI